MAKLRMAIREPHQWPALPRGGAGDAPSAQGRAEVGIGAPDGGWHDTGGRGIVEIGSNSCHACCGAVIPSGANSRSRCATARCAGRTSRESGVRGSAWLGHRPSIGARYSRYSSRKGSPDDRGVNVNSRDASMTNHSTALGSVTPLRQHLVEDMVNVSGISRLTRN